jgi:hypothetical protein
VAEPSDRLVADGTLENRQPVYKRLSAATAAAHRAGTFPDLFDRTRQIYQPVSWSTVGDALGDLRDVYRYDRTDGQTCRIIVGVEKAALVGQVEDWFDPYGVEVVALGGYASQSLVDQARRCRDRRPAVLLYAGHCDPSVEDIARDFVARTACWLHVEHLALTADHVRRFDLPPALGKISDPRASAFESQARASGAGRVGRARPRHLAGHVPRGVPPLVGRTTRTATR